MRRRLRLCAAFVVFAAAAAAPTGAHAQVMVSGVITAAGAGDPIGGASVRAVCHDVATTAAADGSWRLGPLPRGTHELVVEHIGFAARRVEVTTESAAPVRIELTPKPLSLDAMVVTAARRTQALKDVAIATEVVHRSELRRTGSTDLAAALVERTGITLEGGHPVGAGVMLQGLGSERVLVLIDGQPVVGRLSGKLDLSRLPVSTVERIEVVKGPQSTLYGSNAMGGVVNVITRAPEHGAWRTGIDLLGGSRGRLDVGAHAAGGAGRFGYSADAGRRTIELVPGLAGDAGTYVTRLDGAAKLQWQASPSLMLFAGGGGLDESQRWKSGALYSFADNRQWDARAGATWTRGGVVISPMLYATEFRHLTRRSTLPQPVAGSGEQESQRLVEAEVIVAADLGAIDVDAGVEARRDAIRSDRVTGSDRTLHTVEPFLQTTIAGSNWSVVPGARLSWSEQWGTHFTPRIATLFRPAPHIALRASIGQGFRAPSFKELYMEFLNTAAGAGYRVRGNPELQPETSRNITGSIEWAGERVYARAQVFDNRFDDFIETVELADSSGLRFFSYGNIEDGVTRGTELELGATWRGLRAEAGYAWLLARDRRSGASLPGRPRHSARTSLSYARASGLRAALSGVYTGRTLVARTDSTEQVRSGFARFDVRVSQELPRGLELSAGIDNVVGTRPALWPGFVDRQFHLGLSWRAGNAR